MAFNGSLLDGMMIFAEVVEAGSFTAAAERSRHSTSYISKEITKLEERLGVRLFNRTTRSLGLTPEGSIYFQRCQQIIIDAENASLAVNNQIGTPRGILKLSCLIGFGMIYLRPILGEYMDRYPEVKLDINLSDRHVDLVSDGYDVVIRASRQLEDSSFISRKLATSKGCTLASPEYLDKRGTPVHPSELKDHDCICYSDRKNSSVWKYESLEGELVTVDLAPKVLCNSGELELALVLSGQGITRLFEINARDELKNGRLVRLFPDFKEPEINLHLIYPTRKHLSPKVRSFIDFIIERVAV